MKWKCSQTFYKSSLAFLFSLFVLSILPVSLSAYLQKSPTPVLNYLRPVKIRHIKSGIPPIECIYVINLNERPEKWKRTRKLFRRSALFPNRFSAINGWKMNPRAREDLQGPYRHYFGPGHLGCLLSHVSVYKDAYDRGFKYIWICEDDVLFVDEIRKIPSLLEKLTSYDPNWDIFYTDTDSRGPDGSYVPALAINPRPDQVVPSWQELSQKIRLTDDIMRIRNRYGLYSYIMSRRGIKKVLNYFTHVYVWTSIDIDIHYIPGLREYAPTWDIAIPSTDISDTDDRRSSMNPNNRG